MNNTHHDDMHKHEENKADCCGTGCCADEDCDAYGYSAKEKTAYILQWVLLGGAFLFSLLSLLLLPKIVRSAVKKEVVAEQVLKAGGEENYERLNKEIYYTQDYKDMIKQQVELFIEQNKAQMEMYKQQQNAPQAPTTGIDEEEVVMPSGAMAPATGTAQ